MREVSTTEVHLFIEHLKAEAEEKSEGPAMSPPAKRELSQAEYDDLVSSMRADAKMYGTRRN